MFCWCRLLLCVLNLFLDRDRNSLPKLVQLFFKRPNQIRLPKFTSSAAVISRVTPENVFWQVVWGNLFRRRFSFNDKPEWIKLRGIGLKLHPSESWVFRLFYANCPQCISPEVYYQSIGYCLPLQQSNQYSGKWYVFADAHLMSVCRTSHYVAHIPVVLEHIHSHESTVLQSLPHNISAAQESHDRPPNISLWLTQ